MPRFFPSPLSRGEVLSRIGAGHYSAMASSSTMRRENPRRDRERDRSIQSTGLPILRFSGKEIWVDVFKCAGAVLLFLLERAKAERVAAARKPPASERRRSMSEPRAIR